MKKSVKLSLNKLTKQINKEKSGLDLQDRFPFGKWKGYSIKFVIDNDCEYVYWCIDNEMLLLSNEAFQYFEESN